MKCFNQINTDAVGIFAECGKTICKDCTRLIDDILYCKQCVEHAQNKYNKDLLYEAEHGHAQFEMIVDLAFQVS